MIKIGMAKVDLEEALRPANPIRERVEAIALYAQSEAVHTVWVVLDFMDFNLNVVNTLKAAVCKETGLAMDDVHIMTTHNHGAGTPDLETLARLTAQCAAQAKKTAAPAKMRSAHTVPDRQVNFLRRMEVPEFDGVTTLFWGTGRHDSYNSAPFVESAVQRIIAGQGPSYTGFAPTTRPEKPFPPADPDIFALEFRTLDDAPIGNIVRFASHVNTANRAGSFSSDFPFHLRRVMQEHLGGTPMFMTGPCADICPGMESKTSGEEAVLGPYLAERALAALESAKFAPVEQFDARMQAVSLPVHQAVLDEDVGISPEMPEELPARMRWLEAQRMQNSMPFLREKYTYGETELKNTVDIHLGMLRFNDLVIAAFPGETFSETAKAVCDSFPGTDIVTVTEHERTVMYLPPLADCARGGYETTCRVTSDAAEAVLRDAAMKLMDSFIKGE